MTVRIYDTASRRVRDFVPLHEGRVGIYVCGLTVQSEPHVGHIRSGVNFDVLRRWFASRGYEVTYIRNITDIDDKILIKSAEERRTWWAHAYLHERHLAWAYDVLGCLPPTYEPRATGHVPEMVELMGELVERGHAYVAEDGSGDVYFDVQSWPAYGELSGQRVDDMEPATDADPRGKRDPRDFALWKGHKPDEPETASWPTPWGRGRPGWHLECSAMAGKYLGAEFDIHGGGIDLQFPHHENEIAQSKAAGRPFARYWMHNAWITTSGEKMSKSLGNSLLLPAVVQRVRPIELRFYLVSAHYRSHAEFSFEALDEAAVSFQRIEGYVERATEVTGGVPSEFTATCADFEEAMDDDLGTPAAVAAIHDVVHEGNKLLADGDSPALRGNLASVRAMLDVLGVDPLADNWRRASGAEGSGLRFALDSLVGALLRQREEARGSRDFATADAVRDQLHAAGIEVEDTPSGPRWSV
ncbi:MAG: cysteine--tRNA ligase [Propionibacteriales bacterium]|nr:cysteine--tRNA ligase [Propionibacteriales bacterium]